LQYIVEEFDPSAAQGLTTTYADVDGSSYDFTPVSATSDIIYRYSFMVSSPDTQDIIGYFKLQNEGVDETESMVTYR
jgi:hypothetical protein